MSDSTFYQLTDLLNQQRASFRIIFHPNAGKSKDVAPLRGTALSQGAKALVCRLKGEQKKGYVLAILPACQQANLSTLAQVLGYQRASLASPKEVKQLTDCECGSVPPFSFHPALLLVVDPLLKTLNNEIAFNAGTLRQSIILNVDDYFKLTQPTQISFSH